jgi:FKBP-type peptidyl-prolyl cis-trans isomerase (trigger factor)
LPSAACAGPGLGKLGEQNGITVAGDEVQRAIMARARHFPGQEQQVFQFYAKNPQAQAEIRAPLFEDKVVDFIAELATVNDARWTRKPCLPTRRMSRQRLSLKAGSHLFLGTLY